MTILKYNLTMLEGKEIFIREKYDNESFPVHWHEYYELIYYDGLEGVCELNGVPFKISNKCLFFLTPKDYHKIDVLKGKGYSLNISFSETVIDKFLSKNNFIKPCVMYEPNEFFIEITKKITENSKITNSNVKKVEQIHLLNILLTQIVSKGTAVDQKTFYGDENIHKVIATVLTNLSAPNTLSDASKISGLSVGHFCSIFHKEMGQPYKQWLKTVRLDHAKRLLENENMTVIEIAIECGYGNVSHFTQTFKNFIGLTPREYRKKYKKV